MNYTGIGSRDTTLEENIIMTSLGKELATKGWTLRSGGAGGSDLAFENGCAAAKGKAEIFIPWKPFGSKIENVNSKRYVPNESSYDKAREYLIENNIIPWFDRMKQGARKLHARNYYQVLGTDNIKSDIMIYCADDDKNGVPKGGTRTAILLARSFNIPTYNIRVKDQLKALDTLIKGLINDN